MIVFYLRPPVLIQLAHEHNGGHRVSFENAKSAREIVRLRAVPQVGNRKLRVRYSLRRAEDSVARGAHGRQLDIYVGRSFGFL